MKNTRKANLRVKGGFFWGKRADKSPADNVKDFDNLWIDRIDPKTQNFYVYNANTYWPGWTNPGMMPQKNYPWRNGSRVDNLQWRNFEQCPILGEQIIMDSNGAVYVGKVVRCGDQITLVDGRVLNTSTSTTFGEVTIPKGSRWRYKGAKSLELPPAPPPTSGTFDRPIPYTGQIIIVTKQTTQNGKQNVSEYSGVLKKCERQQDGYSTKYILTLGNAYNITKNKFVADVNGKIIQYEDKYFIPKATFTMRTDRNDRWELLTVYQNNSGYNSDIQREFRKRHQVHDLVPFSKATPPIGSEIYVSGTNKQVGNVSSIENNVLVLTNACHYYYNQTYKCDSLGTITIEVDDATWIYLDELETENQKRIRGARNLAQVSPAPAPLPLAPAGGTRRKMRKRKTQNGHMMT